MFTVYQAEEVLRLIKTGQWNIFQYRSEGGFLLFYMERNNGQRYWVGDRAAKQAQKKFGVKVPFKEYVRAQ